MNELNNKDLLEVYETLRKIIKSLEKNKEDMQNE